MDDAKFRLAVMTGKTRSLPERHLDAAPNKGKAPAWVFADGKPAPGSATWRLSDLEKVFCRKRRAG